MTTIAYRDGIMASDSKISSGSDVFVGETDKIFFMEVEESLSFFEKIVLRKEPKTQRFLVGMCGTVEDCLEYIDCIFNGEPQTRSFESSLIVVSEDGLIKKFDGSSVKGFLVRAAYAAAGTGNEIALGAMHHGATAIEAVEAAIHHDNMSGGTIQTLSFENDE